MNTTKKIHRYQTVETEFNGMEIIADYVLVACLEITRDEGRVTYELHDIHIENEDVWIDDIHVNESALPDGLDAVIRDHAINSIDL